MSMGSPTPYGPLAQVRLWGRPWHGRIDHNPFTDAPERWRLQLPNGAVKSLRPIGDVPENIGDFPTTTRQGFQPMSGSNALFQRTDIPAIVRTPTQAAEDAAEGKQWWDRAIVHGQGSLGSAVEWVWCDTSGDRWLVRWHPIYSEGSIRVTLIRFGSFGGGWAGGQLDIPFTLATLGQADPELPADTPAREFMVSDVTPVGDRAIIMVGVMSGNYTSGSNNYMLPLLRNSRLTGDMHLYYAPVLPLGWIEVTMSGTPGSHSWSASVAVLADRATTLGTRTAVWSKGREHRANRMVSDTSPAGYPDVPGLSVELVHTATGEEDVTVASLGGYIGGWATYYRGTDSYVASAAGAIVGMHYEADGIVTYTADWLWTHTLTEDAAFVYEGDEVWRYTRANEGDVWIRQGWGEFGRTRTATYTGSGELSETWTLRRNGVEVSTWESGVYETCVATGTALFKVAEGGNDYSYQLQSSSVAGDIRLRTNGEEISVPRTLDGANGVFGKASPPEVFARFGWDPAALSESDRLWAPVETPPAGIYGPPLSGAGGTLESSRWRRFLLHYSQRCLGYMAYSNHSSVDTILRIGELSTPVGIQPAVPPTAYNSAARPLAFASYNPCTGDVARSEWPVNWI